MLHERKRLDMQRYALVLAMVLPFLANCSKKTSPVKPVTPFPSPLPIEVKIDRPPCHLPELPDSVLIQSQPSSDGSLTLNADELADIVRHVSGLHSWILAAAECVR